MEFLKEIKDKRLRDLVIDFLDGEKWACESGHELINDWISELPSVDTEVICSHRWYDSVINVVKYNGFFISYQGFHTTGDSSFVDMGLEYNLGTLSLVEPYTKTITKYRSI